MDGSHCPILLCFVKCCFLKCCCVLWNAVFSNVVFSEMLLSFVKNAVVLCEMSCFVKCCFQKCCFLWNMFSKMLLFSEMSCFLKCRIVWNVVFSKKLLCFDLQGYRKNPLSTFFNLSWKFHVFFAQSLGKPWCLIQAMQKIKIIKIAIFYFIFHSKL